MKNDSEIDAWLFSNQQYTEGLRILTKYADGNFLISILQTGEDPYNKELLCEEIEKLQQLQKKTAAIVTGIYTGDDYETLPSGIQELIAQAKDLFKINGKLHSQISHAIRKHDRAVLANTILDNDGKIREVLNTIDYFKVHGTMPKIDDNELLQSMNEAEIIHDINLLRSRISKRKKAGKSFADLDIELTNLNTLLDGII